MLGRGTSKDRRRRNKRTSHLESVRLSLSYSPGSSCSETLSITQSCKGRQVLGKGHPVTGVTNKESQRSMSWHPQAWLGVMAVD